MKQKEKLFSKTGAKRFATGAVIGIMSVVSLVGCSNTSALASEDAQYYQFEENYLEENNEESSILSDKQYEEQTGINREEARLEDARQIFENFIGIDEEGYEINSTEDMKKAVVLSYAYNEYADVTGIAYEEQYTNATPSSIINLDIEGLYDDFTQAIDYDYLDEHYQDNIQYKPAIDATIQLSGLPLATQAEYYVAQEAKRCLEDQGIKVDLAAGILTYEGIKVIVEFNGRVAILTLVGEPTTEMNELLLEVRYQTLAAINDLAGGDTAEEDYTGPLAYNGVNKYTGESMYYSIPDDEFKEKIMLGTEYVEGIRDGETLGIELMGDPNPVLSDYDLNLLYSIGYSDEELQNAVSGYLNLYSLKNVYTLG